MRLTITLLILALVAALPLAAATLDNPTFAPFSSLGLHARRSGMRSSTGTLNGSLPGVPVLIEIEPKEIGVDDLLRQHPLLPVPFLVHCGAEEDGLPGPRLHAPREPSKYSIFGLYSLLLSGSLAV